MNKSQQECGDNMDGIQEAHEWCAWKKKKKKKPIGKRELVGLIRDLEKGLET